MKTSSTNLIAISIGVISIILGIVQLTLGKPFSTYFMSLFFGICLAGTAFINNSQKKDDENE